MATGLPSFTVEKVNLPCKFVLPSNKTLQYLTPFFFMRFSFYILVVLIINVYKHNQARNDLDMEWKNAVL